MFGVVFFAIGHFAGQPKCRGAALMVIAACSFAILPYLGLRHSARHLETDGRGTVTATKYDEQTKRYSDVKWVFYALAIMAAFALLGGGKLAQISNIAVIAGGILAVLFAACLRMKDAETYHPNTAVRVAKTTGPAR
jgi:hypothetical protein